MVMPPTGRRRWTHRRTQEDASFRVCPWNTYKIYSITHHIKRAFKIDLLHSGLITVKGCLFLEYILSLPQWLKGWVEWASTGDRFRWMDWREAGRMRPCRWWWILSWLSVIPPSDIIFTCPPSECCVLFLSPNNPAGLYALDTVIDGCLPKGLLWYIYWRRRWPY